MNIQKLIIGADINEREELTKIIFAGGQISSPRYVIITEGKFKAEIISDTFKCPVISIPDVKTFENKVN